MFLKELVLRLNRTLWGQFLREICPLKKMTPKYNAASGIIAGELLKVCCYVCMLLLVLLNDCVTFLVDLELLLTKID
jgi:hypothetical protein